MSNFKNYAKYYDLLYKDKDYSKESKYIMDKIASLSEGGGGGSK